MPAVYDQDPEDHRMQLEMYLFKFGNMESPSNRGVITRETVEALLAEYERHDLDKDGELNEVEASTLLEHRDETMTALERRDHFREMDRDGNHLISFLEWATFVYGTSWEDLHTFTDQAAMDAAKAAMREAMEEQDRIHAEVEARRQAEEKAAADRAAELEAEAKLTGVAGMAAFFKRAAEATGDATEDNAAKIKREAAARKALREAEKKRREAEEMAKELSPEEARRRMEAAQAEADAERARIAEQQKAATAARRKAFRDAQEAKWGGGK